MSKSPLRRCTARSKRTGEQCKNRPIPGGFVCRHHGGASPQAKRKAHERLQELVEPAIEGLRIALASDDLVAITRAATAVLDRCGMSPRYLVQVEDQAVERLRREERAVLFAAFEDMLGIRKRMTAAEFIALVRERLEGNKE